MAQPRLSMATKGLGAQIGWGGRIEGRRILIIAMSEHHVDYMNRKGGHPVIMQGGGGGAFHRCVHQIAWTRAWRQGSRKLRFLLLRLGRDIIRK